MSDNRQRPRIHRCDDKHDSALRAYARSRGIEPWQALETAIERLRDDECDGTIDRLTEELASAREATRRADEEIERLNAKLAAVIEEDDTLEDLREKLESTCALLAKADEDHKKALRLASGMRSDLLLEREAREALRATLAERDTRIAELETAQADWAEASGEQPATSKPARRRAPEPVDFEAKVRARAKAHGQTIERTRARVIELGFSRYDALAKAKGGRAP